MILTHYRIEDIDNYEEFLNKLYNGLAHYKKRNKDFSFEISYGQNFIQLKTLKINGSVN